MLLCSEIGSEGRNFQFAHHLILWDLPLDPDLLEQRIGRLDRIGQQHDITLHAVAIGGTAQHALLRWYDEGLDALRTSPSDGREILRRYGARVVVEAERHALAGDDPDVEIDSLIGETRATHRELSELVQAGRDRLLELASERYGARANARRCAARRPTPTALDEFVLKLFEQFGIDSEEIAPRTVVLDPEYLSTEGFPGLKDGPQQVTFDRATALAREDLPLLRLDHPLVAGALDLLLESEQGNASLLIDATLPPRTALLECVFVLECVADAKLDVRRFLPPLPLRIVVDNRLNPRNDFEASAASLARAKEQPIDAARYRPMLAKLVAPMLAAAETQARGVAATEIGAAVTAAERRARRRTRPPRRACEASIRRCATKKSRRSMPSSMRCGTRFRRRCRGSMRCASSALRTSRCAERHAPLKLALALRRARLLRHHRQHRGDLVAHLPPVDDHVDRAMIEQELRALKSFGQRFAHGLLDDARTGEADQFAGGYRDAVLHYADLAAGWAAAGVPARRLRRSAASSSA